MPGYISLRVIYSPYKDNVHIPTATASFSLAILPVLINLLWWKGSESLKQMFEFYSEIYLCLALTNHCLISMGAKMAMVYLESNNMRFWDFIGNK